MQSTNVQRVNGVSMLTEKAAIVRLADSSSFNSMANNVNGMKEGYTTSVTIDGETTEGWVLVDTNPPFFHGEYHIILRHPVEDAPGTAEYIGILLSDDGHVMYACQLVLSRDDAGYEVADFEHFDALWSAPTR